MVTSLGPSLCSLRGLLSKGNLRTSSANKVIKLFSFVNDKEANEIELLYPCLPFQPLRMLAGKARSLSEDQKIGKNLQRLGR
jgi:hypothetical protein